VTRKTLRIARWEVARSAGTLDRRTLVALAAVLVVLAALVPALAGAGGTPDRGVYRVAVAEDNPYRPAVERARTLRAIPVEGASLGDDAEIRIASGGPIRYDDSQKGRAAVTALRDAVAAYNDDAMREEPDQAAAFPVAVRLRYVERSGSEVPMPGRNDGTGTDGDTGGGGEDGSGTDESDGGDGGSDTGGGGGEDGSDADDGAGGVGGAIRSAGQALLGGQQSGSPSDIAAPFPLRSLVLAFAFLLPLNVVIQAYGSSMMTERLNRRGELLLVSPATRFDIIAGKTLPYLAGSLLLVAAIAAAIGAGPLSVAAVVPIALLFLASTFVGAMFARSFTELTFVTVTVSVFITTYAFVPAIFTDIHPIAAISPLSVVVRDLTGAPVAAETMLFSTLPMTLAALVLFALGAGVYREEDMFTQLAPPAKAVDAVAAHLTLRRVPVWTALSLPFVFVAELFSVAVLFVLPVAVSLPLLLAVIALVEELAKSLPVYAGFERARFPRDRRTALVAGALSGVGFAVAEKFSLVAQLVGLPDLELGRAAFAGAAASGPMLAALLVAPFALHVTTAAVSALGARRSTRAYAGALVVAVGIHVVYNAVVVSSLA
jgi:ABC-type Na+ efflux pump permease subunit